MKKGYIKLLIISFLLMLLLILNTLFNKLNTYTLILFLFIITSIFIYVLGYEKNNHRYQKDILLTVIIYSIAYTIITNILGIYVGFNKTGFNLTFLPILENILPVILIIILSEIIRYIIIRKAASPYSTNALHLGKLKKRKLVTPEKSDNFFYVIKKGGKYKTIHIVCLIIFVLLDITLIIDKYNLKVLDELINFVIAIILPSVSRNIMLIYLTYKVGYKPGILYRFMSELPLFLLPIFPDFGIYITSILQIISPAILLYIVYNNFDKIKNKNIIIRKSRINQGKITSIAFIIIMLIIIILSSGLFKYYFLTIGSESMEKAINKGDMIIVKKLNDEEVKYLEVGDVLVFNYSEKIVVHRIVRILVNQNNYYFYTKGDNNEAEDGYPIEKKDVIGIVVLKIPYLGYPAVLLNEAITK